MVLTRVFLITGLCWVGLVQATPEIQHWQTSNGARVYFVPAHELPMVDVRVVFDAGSARDGGKAGLALMTNGLMDEGAAGLDSDELAGRFDSLGAQFGGHSMKDMAMFTLRSLNDKHLLQPALKTMAQVLSQPDFPTDALERERARVLTSLQHEAQSPGAISGKAFYSAVYGEHPYGQPANGTEESIKALTRKDLQNYHGRYYVAHNALVAIVGDVSRAEAEQMAENLLAGLKEGEAVQALPKVTGLAHAKNIHIDHPSSQTHVLMGQPGMRRGDDDYFPLYVGNHVLGGGGFVSRITNEVREKRGLSYSAYSYFTPMREEGPFTLGLQTANKNVAEALTVLKDTLDTFIQQGPTEKELEASKKNITGGLALRTDSNKDIIGYIAMIGFYGQPLDYLDTFIDTVNAVTVAQVRDAYLRRVIPPLMVTVTVGGEQGVEPAGSEH